VPHAPWLKLEMTEEVITESEKRDSGHCMIATAVKNAYPDAERIAVDVQTIRFSDAKKGLRYTYLTPRQGQIALVRFDQGLHTEPFSMGIRGGAVTAMKGGPKLGKPRTRRGGNHAAPNAVPEIVGGITPPVSALAHGATGPASKEGIYKAREVKSRNPRRQYGIRSLEL
jgi:hypothetical protein